jgi:hypothetical protein
MNFSARRSGYQPYRRPGTETTMLRTIGYALPAVLHPHVQTVVLATYFSSTRTRRPVVVRLSIVNLPAPVWDTSH